MLSIALDKSNVTKTPSLACLITGLSICSKDNLPKSECAWSKPDTVPGTADAL